MAARSWISFPATRRRRRISWLWRLAMLTRKELRGDRLDEGAPQRAFRGGDDCAVDDRACAGGAWILRPRDLYGSVSGEHAGDDYRAGDDADYPYRPDRYLGGVGLRDLQRGDGGFGQVGIAGWVERVGCLCCRRGVRSFEWCAGRLSSRAVDCRDAGDDGGSARRAALADTGLVGRGSAQWLSMAR